MVNINDLKHSILELLNHEVIQRLSHVFMGWKPEGQIIIYIFLALVIGFMLGRYRRFHGASFQNRGESLLSRIVLADLGPPDYHLMNHVTLRMSDGTTQIDHVLVSRFGVFVIETKDYKGWIFANANQENWTQLLFNWSFKFQNPIRQNVRHVRAVQSLLDFLPPDAIKSAVVFTGEAEFRTEIPQGVFRISGLIGRP